MSEEHREPPQAVLEAYGCAGARVITETVKKKKAVWYVERPGGLWVLKQSSLSENRLRFVLAAAEHLRGRGVRLPAVIPTKAGKPYVACPEGLFFMMERLEGRNPSYEAPAEREAILQALARFHRASEGFLTGEFPEARVQLGEWPSLYLKRLDALQEPMGTGPFWALARPHHELMVHAARTALERLQRSSYASWTEAVRAAGGLCHQDFAAGNLLMDPSGALAVLDLDSISVEIPARDLRKILIKVLKKSASWNHELAASMLEAYHRVNPLTAAQYAVLQADLIFPHLYHGLIDKYRRGRAPEWSEAVFLSKLERVVAFERAKWEVLSSRPLLPASLAAGRETHGN